MKLPELQALTPIDHDLIPGSREWELHRLSYHNASETAAMLGISPYMTREELKRAKKYGIWPETSAWTQRIYDDGHDFEALARPVAERLTGERMPAVRVTRGHFGASLDGRYMDDATLSHTNWEHKTANAAIREAFGGQSCGLVQDRVTLPEHLRAQMQHQMMVQPADMCLFSATSWRIFRCGSAELLDEYHCWEKPDPEFMARILSGWERFDAEVAEMPEVREAPAIEGQLMPVVRTFPALPKLELGLVAGDRRALTASHQQGRQFLATINKKLVTEQDFVNGASDCKALKKAVELIDLMLSASEEIATLELMRKEFNDARIALEKQLAADKQAAKTNLVREYRGKLQAHIAALDCPNYRDDGNFEAAVHGKSSIDSMHNALEAELGQRMHDADQDVARIKANLAHPGVAAHPHLFADLNSLCQRLPEDFNNAVAARIALQAETQAKAEAERIASAKTYPVPMPQPTPIIEITKAKPDEPKLNLGQINEALRVVSVTREQLATLGFNGEPGERKGLVVYAQSDLAKIKRAIITALGANNV
jgi:predicted phage-related endonuclease